MFITLDTCLRFVLLDSFYYKPTDWAKIYYYYYYRAADGGMTRASEPRSKNFVTGMIVNVKLSNLYMNSTVILVIKKMAIMRTK